MIIPTGTSALLYVPASIGAVAVPPIFASDATAQVNISSLNSFARSSLPDVYHKGKQPRRQPCRSIPDTPEVGAGGYQRNHDIQQTLETSSVPRSFPNGAHCQEYSEHRYNEHRPGSAVEEREHIPDCPAELRTNRRYQKPRACQHQNVLPCERAGNHLRIPARGRLRRRVSQ